MRSQGNFHDNAALIWLPPPTTEAYPGGIRALKKICQAAGPTSQE